MIDTGDARVRLDVDDGIATVRIDRPQARNAIDLAMRRALQAAWRVIADDASIRAAVVTGTGDLAFSAGADLKEPEDAHGDDASSGFDPGGDRSLAAGMEMDTPLVCAFNGLAYGGGLEIGLACDIRLAVPDARFALPEVCVGTIPGSGGTARLPRLVRGSDAALMLLAGESIDAQTALRIGLVSRLVARDELQREAQALARRIAANAPRCVRAVKRLMRTTGDLPQALEAERVEWRLLRGSEDRQEGRRAFAQRRAPVFKGR